MEGYSGKDECPQLLDLITRGRDWVGKREEETIHDLSVEKKLELSLGPPGRGDWTIKDNNSTTEPLSFGYFFPRNGVLKSPWQHHPQTRPSSFIHLPSGQLPARKEFSQPCSNKTATAAAPAREFQNSEKKAFSSPSPAATKPVFPNSSSAQKRTAPAPVVGWPPIRSSRKNISSGNPSKLPPESPEVAPNKGSYQKPAENSGRSLFVKINMDGIPIGRKVDLKFFDSYEKLSCAVNELFRGLLAAQRASSAGGINGSEDCGEVIRGLLDGSGEYTLVYEDNEGDRMLVGDVPWQMFVLSVKRLRVLKSSELPKLDGGKKGVVWKA